MGSKNKVKKLKKAKSDNDGDEENEITQTNKRKHVDQLQSLQEKKLKKVNSDDDEDEENEITQTTKRKHVDQLQSLQEKDPEFYEYLKEHDKELLEFDVEEEEDDYTEKVADAEKKTEEPLQKAITINMVDSWCSAILENTRIGAVRSIMRAFRIACHYGDDGEGDSSAKFSIMSSTVFNKVMLFVLSEMDGILRALLKFQPSGGKKETVLTLMKTRQWKNYSHLVKSYLGNALHVLNQMTDAEMISFVLRRLRHSSLFLVAFPSLLRKYMKVVLHFWGTGEGALPVVSFLFLRDLCVRIGSDCVDECFKGIYKAYVLNCQFVNASKLQRIRFLGNCVNELLGVDLPAAYQHGFVFIRRLAGLLQEALDTGKKEKVQNRGNQKQSNQKKPEKSGRKKEVFRRVYEWKYINCLELWAGAVCAYNSDPDFRPLAYPLTQIISGVARLVPTARFFPIRLRCVRMLNRIASATNTYIPVAMLLLDMLEMKELSRPPTGGVGKAVDLNTILKVSKSIIKTRSFQEACVFSVVEELAEHLAQWSYSIAFFELSFIPAVRLRNFCKSTKVERFRREMKELIRQIEANSEFTNKKRMSVSYNPNNPAAASFLEEEKKEGASPLSQYVAMLRKRSEQKAASLKESSVLVGEDSSIFEKNKRDESDDDDDDDNVNEKGAEVFSSSWLPAGVPKTKQPKGEKDKKEKAVKRKVADDEDLVEDLVLSSDEDASMSDADSSEGEEDGGPNPPPSKQQKPPQKSGKRKKQFHGKKWKKRKTAN